MPSQMWAGGTRAPWRYTIDLTAMQVINEGLPEGKNDEVPEGVQRRIVDLILDALDKGVVPLTDEITERLDLILYSDEMWELQQEWESFYDYCDDERIWVETA